MCFVISNFSCLLRKVWKSSHIHCVIFLRYDKLQTAQDCWIVVDTVSVSYKSIIFNYLMRSSAWIRDDSGWKGEREGANKLWMFIEAFGDDKSEPLTKEHSTLKFFDAHTPLCRLWACLMWHADKPDGESFHIFLAFWLRKIVVVMYGNKWERRKLVYEHASHAMIHKYSSDSSSCTSPTCFRVASKQNVEIVEKFEIFRSPVKIPEPWCGIWRGVSLAK